MPFTSTDIPGLIIFEPRVLEDERGYFYESYRADLFADAGIDTVFIQDNQAFSYKGALRGLHFQTGAFAQAKLVRVTTGKVLDVAVDIRPNSPTFGQHFKIELSAENHLQMFVPRGFAHGYLVLSDTAVFCYKCDNYYSKLHEGGIRFDDPKVDIQWGVPAEMMKVSVKDLELPGLESLILNG